MNQIKAKIYYELATGNILVITPEGQIAKEPTTKEEDMQKYLELKYKSIDEVDYIELEYGTLISTVSAFASAKSYSMNLETKKLKCIYFSEEELQEINLIQTQEIQKNQETQTLDNRVSDISQYLQNQGSQSISDVEDYILQSEQNKILNGGM